MAVRYHDIPVYGPLGGCGDNSSGMDARHKSTTLVCAQDTGRAPFLKTCSLVPLRMSGSVLRSCWYRCRSSLGPTDLDIAGGEFDFPQACRVFILPGLCPRHKAPTYLGTISRLWSAYEDIARQSLATTSIGFAPHPSGAPPCRTGFEEPICNQCDTNIIGRIIRTK